MASLLTTLFISISISIPFQLAPLTPPRPSSNLNSQLLSPRPTPRTAPLLRSTPLTSMHARTYTLIPSHHSLPPPPNTLPFALRNLSPQPPSTSGAVPVVLHAPPYHLCISSCTPRPRRVRPVGAFHARHPTRCRRVQPRSLVRQQRQATTCPRPAHFKHHDRWKFSLLFDGAIGPGD
ncbi:hypothetical protein BU26DRAFT_517656 [Trematosphaeria pertusa]|uniref:Uncharacterized protein n=1 Tax=Trematosphaeria pertusa TaxID=390896 RepID=A0A6A6IKY8_9PLEO|nr:uncharacterized protein BU26DRAFT_517656 [Trematosphaeria pertusa]KAF2250879.1 hypothetical protein BU26DRAFT_517656 [Trematosphaeria pertusa]